MESKFKCFDHYYNEWMNGILCVSMGKKKKAQKGDQHTKKEQVNRGKGFGHDSKWNLRILLNDVINSRTKWKPIFSSLRERHKFLFSLRMSLKMFWDNETQSPRVGYLLVGFYRPFSSSKTKERDCRYGEFISMRFRREDFTIWVELVGDFETLFSCIKEIKIKLQVDPVKDLNILRCILSNDFVAMIFNISTLLLVATSSSSSSREHSTVLASSHSTHIQRMLLLYLN